MPISTGMPDLDPLAVATRFDAAALAHGFRVEKFGGIAGFPLFALTKRTPGPRPRIYLSSGIHGDEPAPPLALLRLIERGFFDERATWFICPLLNPVGLARGTRENAGGLDLNRDYRDPASAEIRAHVAWLQRQPRFDLALVVHEDWESKGFYLYELNRTAQPGLAKPILEAVRAVCPIELAEQIDGRPASGGIIRPEGDPTQRDVWPESIYLHAHHTTHSYGLETPSALPLDQRIAAHCAAIETTVKIFLTANRR
ncbi:MAG TPA: M14 family metallocarboxypeptidase [Opitutaceae bacterium]|nr:M14 family metallocarboxypeptidase [Opitutaceae bacterium]